MSNDFIEGVVEQASCKQASDAKSKYGASYQIGLKIDGEWFNGLSKKTAEDLGLGPDADVGFETYEKNGYTNIDMKSLEVYEESDDPPEVKKDAGRGNRQGGGRKSSGGSAKQGSAPKRDGNAGMAVGHAINNAVHLAVADGDTSLEHIHSLSTKIIALSIKLQGQYSDLVENIEEILGGAGDDEEDEEKPQRKRAARKKSTATKRAATKKAPARRKAKTEEESDDGGDDDGFDDDIPFG